MTAFSGDFLISVNYIKQKLWSLFLISVASNLDRTYNPFFCLQGDFDPFEVTQLLFTLLSSRQ